MTGLRRLLCLALILCAWEARAMDIASLWNFDDPAASEARFRAALAQARGDDALSLQTQIARTYSLRRRFDEAHALLDTLAPQLADAGAEPRVRALLERGRTFRSARERDKARPLFEQAAALAQSAGLEFLAIDALHMVALVQTDPQEELRWNRTALAAAQAARDPAAREWEGSLSNNLGMTLHGLGRYREAMDAFRTQLAVRERQGRPARIRVARWMIAWTHRALGEHDAALALLHTLDRELAAAKASDGYVPEEIGENLLALGRGDEARPWFARALAEHRAAPPADRPAEASLARLERLARGADRPPD
jgi:tetratricopeptide (TPR) repeat protein